MLASIRRISRLPGQTFEIDGLHDISSGIIVLLATMAEFVQCHIRDAAPHATASNYRQVVAYSDVNFRLTAFLDISVLLCCVLVVRPLFDNLRRRFAYPRLGHVVPRIDTSPLMLKSRIGLTLSLILVISAANGLWIDFSNEGPWSLYAVDDFVIFAGILGAIIFLADYSRTRVPRHFAIAAISLLTSIGLAALHLEGQRACMLLQTVIGATLILSGTSAFLRLLRLPMLGKQE